eukprot:1148918-Pelagomonas_calceolata.AAC.1
MGMKLTSKFNYALVVKSKLFELSQLLHQQVCRGLHAAAAPKPWNCCRGLVSSRKRKKQKKKKKRKKKNRNMKKKWVWHDREYSGWHQDDSSDFILRACGVRCLSYDNLGRARRRVPVQYCKMVRFMGVDIQDMFLKALLIFLSTCDIKSGSALSVKIMHLFLSTTSLYHIFIPPTGCPV